ncbi:MAG: RNA-binding protein [Pirellulaceae bacterium]|nr:MAG: RNA-binding protein [Pirellulaceae bacterium]
MIELEDVARRHHMKPELLRVAADLIEQGFTPSFVQRYRADETGGVPLDVLWDLKLSAMRRQRLEAAKQRHLKQLSPEAVLDEEAQQSLATVKYEAEVEAALRCFRARRNLHKAEQRAGDAGQLLEQLIAFEGQAPENLATWVAEQKSIDAAAAERLLGQVRELVSGLLAGDTQRQQTLRQIIRETGKLSLVWIEPVGGKESSAASDREQANSGAKADNQSTAEATDFTDTADPANEDAGLPKTPTDQGEDKSAGQRGAHEGAAVMAAPSASTDDSANSALASAGTETEVVDPSAPRQPAGGDDAGAATQAATTASLAPSDDTPASDGEVNAKNAASAEPAAAGENPAGEMASPVAEDGKGSGKKTIKALEKAAKATPRQRRRKWLQNTLQGYGKKPRGLGKWSAYQHLMIARGVRAQLIRAQLDVDLRRVVRAARDALVSRNHPLRDWFEQLVESILQEGLLKRLKNDVLHQCEEEAQETLLRLTAERTRRQLWQSPVRGQTIMLIDTVGPKTVVVVVVNPAGEVIGTAEVDCSAKKEIVDRNVVQLGEMIHQHRVTLVALSNGPARRFMVHTVRELMQQSAGSGLQWTMADRSLADSYAATAASQRELPHYNRRQRAAVWAARALQDPLAEHMKVDIQRWRLSNYQRELPSDEVRETIQAVLQDTVHRTGLDVLYAHRRDLELIPGLPSSVASQILHAAELHRVTSRQLITQLGEDWDVKQQRQAVVALRVLGGAEPLDATLIHPDDYPLAHRLVKHTDLQIPPNSPPGWAPPAVESAGDSASGDPGDASPSHEAASDATPAEDSSAAAEREGDEAAAATATGRADNAPVGAEAVEATIENQPRTTDTAAEATDDAEAAGKPVSAAEDVAAEAPSNTADHVDATASGEAGKAPADSPVESSQAATPEGDASQQTNVTAPSTAGQDSQRTSRPAHRPFVVADSDGSEAGGQGPVEGRQTSDPGIDVEKLAKEWQVGRHRLRWVATCLRHPFTDWRADLPPVPRLNSFVELKDLQPGMCLWGVVSGIADFGAFVELAPHCNGLVHVSRLSTQFIEDPHEVVQVGDLLAVWVLSVEEEKQRVALTALPPGSHAEESARPGRDERTSRSRHARSGQAGRSGSRPDHRSSGDRSPEERRGSASARPPSRRDDDRRSRSRRQRQDGRGSRGGTPRSIVVESKKPVAPITDAMRQGNEPLRSFADLMQFYEAKRTGSSADEGAPQEPASENPASTPSASSPAAEDAAAQDAPQAEERPLDLAHETGGKANSAPPSDASSHPEETKKAEEPADAGAGSVAGAPSNSAEDKDSSSPKP